MTQKQPKVFMPELRKISELKFAKYNPRKITPEELKKIQNSMDEFGFVEPIVINKDGTIIGGHQRTKVLREMGATQIPCIVLNLTKKKEKIMNVALNKLGGEFDEDKLREIFKEILADTTGAEDILLTGFESTEIDVLLENDAPDIDGLTDEDSAPETIPDQPKTKLGDIYRLGEHFLICGDSTDQATYDRLFRAAKIDIAAMTFTDPPYNVDYESTDGKKIKNDKMGRIAFGKFLRASCDRIVRNTQGTCYICMSSSEIDTIKREWRSAGGHFSNFIIWAKNTFTLGRGDYHHQFEPILYGWDKKKKNHYFCGKRTLGNVWSQKGMAIEETPDGKYRISFDDPAHKRMITVEVASLADVEVDGKDIMDVWNVDKPVRNRAHPTMKPVELIDKAIRNSSKHGEWILDSFAGSGSTIISCEKTGRKCAAIELDPRYCDAILQRYEEYTGIAPVAI